MFHWVRGVPFEFNAGAYDNLNMWEQIDNGAQYTPAKKFLLSVPIVLFLLSTHYTHYDLTYFTINFLAVLGVVIPKLPYVCRQGYLVERTNDINRVIARGWVSSQELQRIGSMDECMAIVRCLGLWAILLWKDTPNQRRRKMYLRQQRNTSGLGYINHSDSWKRCVFSETSHQSLLSRRAEKTSR
jgi:hypothetical protein